jgi:protein SCO1/2
VLKTYAEIFDIGPGWSFLTGEPGDIELLRRRLGFTDPDPLLDADLETHIGLVKYGIEKLDRWGGLPRPVETRNDRPVYRLAGKLGKQAAVC